jgi:hypothetical protein
MNRDLITPEGVKALMESSTSEAEWNANCEKVKAANGGYPAFWYSTIVMSGLMGKVTANFRK